MKYLADIIDETNLSINEIKNLIKCLNIMLKYTAQNNPNHSQTLLFTKFIENRFEHLQNDFKILEDKVYREILLNK